MKKIALSENFFLSEIVHGWWRAESWNNTPEQNLKLIEKCIELGITSFDHADIYGGGICEELFGAALSLKPKLREKIQIITKCGIRFIHPNMPKNDGHYYDTSYEHIMYAVNKSLKGLCTDYIDLLLIHRPDIFMNPLEVKKAFKELKSSGKVRHFGVSNFTPVQFEMLQSYLDFPLITNQLELSVASCENFENGAIDNSLKHRIKPMAWSPLDGGKLFTETNEKYVRLRFVLERVREEVAANNISEVAYAWLFNHPSSIIPVAGTKEIYRLMDAVNATNIELTKKQWFQILDANRGYEVP